MPKTINALTVTTTAAGGDFVPIWRAANSDTRKITKANFVGAVITGGGTIATGGFTLTVGANSTINGSVVGNISGGGTLASGGFTLTVPATGTAALINLAQIYTAANTFSALITASAGINFGGTTLNVYSQNTWVPVDASAAGLTLTVAAGRYTRIGRMVFANFNVTYPSTADAVNAASIGGLPFTPQAIGGTTGGGGFVFTSSLNIATFLSLTTSATFNMINATTGAGFKNSDMSTKTLRGWIIYDV
jgi:hypothetical protein